MGCRKTRSIQFLQTAAAICYESLYPTEVAGLVDSMGRVHEPVPWWSEQTLASRITLSDEMDNPAHLATQWAKQAR
jgi:hypothetical protein